MTAGRWLFYFAAPPRLAALAGRLVRPLMGLAALLALAGLWLGFVATPADTVQGEGYRLLYLHVPAAWMSMWCYALMAGWSFVGLVWRVRTAFWLSHALAPTGAVFAALSLATGMLWGQPMWGTWWGWDARLSTSLLLFFLYLGYLALLQAHEGEQGEPERADRGGAVLALLGALNLPVIYFSVRWWNTLHQGASLSPGQSHMAPPMLAALLLMTAAAWAYAAGTTLRRVQVLIAERQAGQRWREGLALDDAEGPAHA